MSRGLQKKVPGGGETVEKKIRLTRAVNQSVRPAVGWHGYQFDDCCALADINSGDAGDEFLLLVLIR